MPRSDYDRSHMLIHPFDRIDEARLERRQVTSGDVLFHEASPTRGMFAAVDVAVMLTRTTPQGDRVVIHRARPGETFAEASLFAETYHCDAHATGQGEVLCLPKNVVLPLFADETFARAYNQMMSQQVQRYRLQVQILSIKSADERVFAAMTAGFLESTVMDFAATIGLTHEASYRSLRRLVQAGRIVKAGRGEYEIPAAT